MTCDRAHVTAALDECFFLTVSGNLTVFISPPQEVHGSSIPQCSDSNLRSSERSIWNRDVMCYKYRRMREHGEDN